MIDVEQTPLGSFEENAFLRLERVVQPPHALGSLDVDRVLRLDVLRFVAGDEADPVGRKTVAKQRRIAELFHQRHRELVIGIRQDRDRVFRAQTVEERLGARQRRDARDDALDVLEPDLLESRRRINAS